LAEPEISFQRGDAEGKPIYSFDLQLFERKIIRLRMNWIEQDKDARQGSRDV